VVSDVVVLIAILVNAASSAVEHFEGYAVPTDPGTPRFLLKKGLEDVTFTGRQLENASKSQSR